MESKICRVCGKPFEQYGNKKIKTRCRDCYNAYQRKYNQENRDRLHTDTRRRRQERPDLTHARDKKYREKNKKRLSESQKEWNNNLKKTVFEAYGGCICWWCAEEDMLVLSLDHVNNDGYKRKRSHWYGWLKKNNYPKTPPLKVLCMNCQFAKKINNGVLPEDRWQICAKKDDLLDINKEPETGARTAKMPIIPNVLPLPIMENIVPSTVRPILMKTCTACHVPRPLDQYHKRRDQCKFCMAAYMKKYDKERNTVLKKAALDAYGGRICAWCSETGMLILSLDHVNNDGSAHRKIIGTSLYRWLGKNNYPQEPPLQVLCINCQVAKKNNNGVLPLYRHKMYAHRPVMTDCLEPCQATLS